MSLTLKNIAVVLLSFSLVACGGDSAEEKVERKVNDGNLALSNMNDMRYEIIGYATDIENVEDMTLDEIEYAITRVEEYKKNGQIAIDAINSDNVVYNGDITTIYNLVDAADLILSSLRNQESNLHDPSYITKAERERIAEEQLAETRRAEREKALHEELERKKAELAKKQAELAKAKALQAMLQEAELAAAEAQKEAIRRSEEAAKEAKAKESGEERTGTVEELKTILRKTLVINFDVLKLQNKVKTVPSFKEGFVPSILLDMSLAELKEERALLLEFNNKKEEMLRGYVAVQNHEKYEDLMDEQFMKNFILIISVIKNDKSYGTALHMADELIKQKEELLEEDAA